MVLELSPAHLEAIATHAAQTYPEECCGLLLGQIHRDRPDVKTLVEVWATENVWNAEIAASLDASLTQASTKETYYWIDPKEMLAAQKYGRSLKSSTSDGRGLDIIGIYHSHPDHPAIPSQFDRTYAWSQYSYIIVSVQQGKAVDIRSWSLDEQHNFQPEDLLMVGSVQR